MVLTCLLRKYHGALYSRHSKASSLFILQSLFKNKGLRVSGFAVFEGLGFRS